MIRVTGCGTSLLLSLVLTVLLNLALMAMGSTHSFFGAGLLLFPLLLGVGGLLVGGGSRRRSRRGGPFGSDPYGRDPYGRDPYGRRPSGRDELDRWP